MITFEKGQRGDLEEILDLINLVFSMSSGPHDFATLLPKLYGQNKETEPWHYLARENDKLVACVCVMPLTFTHSGQSISSACIGSVSVHPGYRGNGYMKKLMEMAAADMKKQGIVFHLLSGQRQRYQYFGYEKAGQMASLSFNTSNLRHAKQKQASKTVSLKQISSVDTHSDTISKLYALHQNQSLFTHRSLEDFHAICSSWNHRLYGIIDEGNVVGYLCGKDHEISELVLSSDTYLLPCLNAYLALMEIEAFTLQIPLYKASLLNQALLFCETWSLNLDDNYQIHDWKRFLHFWMQVKANSTKLTEGRLCIQISEDPPFLIQVKNQNITIRSANDEEVIDLQLTHHEAARTLLSPLADLSPKGECFTNLGINWFPLPLAISSIDKC